MSENILKKLREEKRKTQKEVAAELGYHTTTYARWEQELHEIKLVDAINIAKYYGVSLDYLAGLNEDKDGAISIKQIVNIERKNK